MSVIGNLQDRMKRARIINGHSHTQAAAILGVSATTVSNAELGTHPPRNPDQLLAYIEAAERRCPDAPFPTKALAAGGHRNQATGAFAAKCLLEGLDLLWWRAPDDVRALDELPREVEAVVVLKSWCNHSVSDRAVAQARQRGIPFAIVADQWSIARPALAAAGLFRTAPRPVQQELTAAPEEDRVRPASGWVSLGEMAERVGWTLSKASSEIKPKLSPPKRFLPTAEDTFMAAYWREDEFMAVLKGIRRERGDADRVWDVFRQFGDPAVGETYMGQIDHKPTVASLRDLCGVGDYTCYPSSPTGEKMQGGSPQLISVPDLSLEVVLPPEADFAPEVPETEQEATVPAPHRTALEAEVYAAALVFTAALDRLTLARAAVAAHDAREAVAAAEKKAADLTELLAVSEMEVAELRTAAALDATRIATARAALGL